MESAELVMLDGLCSGHGTWKCRSGCPGAFAVRVERGRGSSRGDIVLNRGLVPVRLRVAVRHTFLAGEQLSCLSSW